MPPGSTPPSTSAGQYQALSSLLAEAMAVVNQEVEPLVRGASGYWRSGTAVEVDPDVLLASGPAKMDLPGPVIPEGPPGLSSRDVKAVPGEATLPAQQASLFPELYGQAVPHPVQAEYDPAVHGESSGAGTGCIPDPYGPSGSGSSANAGLGQYEQHWGGGKMQQSYGGKGKGKSKEPTPKLGEPGWTKYKNMRDQNNKSEKKSRLKAKEKNEYLLARKEELEQENARLRSQHTELTKELKALRQLAVSHLKQGKPGQRKPE